MRSRTSPISWKEKMATTAPVTASPLIPRKASSNRLATPSRCNAHARAFWVSDAAEGLDLTKFMSVPCYRRWRDAGRLRPSSSERVRQGARIEKGAFRNVSPAQGRGPKLDEAVVDPPRQIVLAAGLVEHFAGHLAERLQDRIVELADLNRRIIGDLLQRDSVVCGEIRV